MVEVWRDVRGYEGLYQVSNLGNVKHLSYVQDCMSVNNVHYVRVKPEHLLKPAPMRKKNGVGYLGVSLHKFGKQRTVAVHRMVAEAFIPNSENKPQVNHKDENKWNNTVTNLEWCDCSYNVNYGSANRRRSLTMTGVKKARCRS